jgi:hypothetical protein
MFKKVLVDCHAEIEFDMPYYIKYKKPEEVAQYLEVEARELIDFIRDHRSQDKTQINIVRDFQELCEFCHSKKELSLDEDGTPVCCNKAIIEYENAVDGLIKKDGK